MSMGDFAFDIEVLIRSFCFRLELRCGDTDSYIVGE